MQYDLQIKQGQLDKNGLCKYFRLKPDRYGGKGLFTTRSVEAGTIVWVGGFEKDVLRYHISD